ncbi:sulfide:quinone oxidoreductase, mitochondrial-like [Ostrinia furnacalis]|uniref:sulfide:quinone oxidoreductase, mitochondrial-like n=1 Tax=Ostrinia furnacalis TaxID=93504 RepID=UPI00103FC102|nr:sulfide:quinone oxidoreductase, mitochondrial-like [Ostrinia furnacalis]
MSCKLLVVGGGTGGCSIAWRFARKLKGEDIIVVEPSQIHYYQPQFTLVAAGISKFKESHRPQKSVLPKDVRWIQDRAVEFDPCNCVVHTCGGDKISYDYMVVAVGLVNDYDKSQPAYKKATYRQQKSVLPKDVRWIQDRAVEFDPCNCVVHTCGGDKISYDYMVVAVGLVNDYDKSHRPQKSVLPKDVRWIQNRAVEFDPCNCVVHTCGGDKISYDYMVVAVGLVNDYDKSYGLQKAVLPKDVRWIQDRAVEFDPCNCVVHTCGGNKISYDYMVVAVELANDYDKIPGLKEALDNPKSGVSTIYASEYCEKTWRSIRSFRGGHAVFTFPRTAGKCSGAAQKIMYLADDYWRKHKIRHLANITYATAGNAIFGVEKYATALMGVAANRCIAVNYCLELVELTCVAAVFVDSAGQTITLPYNLLHVTPPMSPPVDLRRCTELVTAAGYLLVDQHSLQHQLSANYKSTITLPYNLLHVTPPMSPPVDLRRCTELVTAAGYLLVDQHSLQHQRYGNVFGVGDCLCTPNSKTAAAIAQQTAVVEQNLTAVMQGMEPIARYNGYGACPLLTSYSKGILAEFVYDKKPWETFPFDQL